MNRAISLFPIVKQVQAQTKEWQTISEHCVINDVATVQGVGCLLANVLSVVLRLLGITGFVMIVYAAFNLLMSRRKRDFRVVNIDIPEEETIKRLVKRMRHDDTPEIIRQRIRIFQKNTKPVIEKYRAKKLVTNINGNQSIEDVAAEINRHLDSYFLKNHRN